MELDKLATEKIVCHLVADSIDSSNGIVAVIFIWGNGNGHIFQCILKCLDGILVIIFKKLIQLGEGDSRLLQTHYLQHLSSTVVHLGALLIVGIEI